MTLAAASAIFTTAARAIAPRKPMTVSQWADVERILSSKGSAEPGRWRTSRTPFLREPMDCMSARSTVRNVALRFPIQIGKTECAVNVLGYVMDHHPGPIMVCLPGEVTMNKWIAQKLNPALEATPAMRRAMTSTASRDSSNQRAFKDFAGGQLYLEHAGNVSRLKLTSVRTMIVDEVDDFSASLHSGDDPLEMLEGRTSAFPSISKHMYISSPGIRGISRIDDLFERGDQRYYQVRCPHCNHRQHLQWAGLHWYDNGNKVAYVCPECGAEIYEHHKPDMLAEGRWVPENPESRWGRSYTLNALYYPLGLGPRWATLAEMWRSAQGDQKRLKTFINDRLAESWEDPAMRAVQHKVISDRAEPYPIRFAPEGVLACTAGVDTQDNRLAVHITGWGKGLECWTLDYVELPGDPANDEVWVALTELLSRPISHVLGGVIRPEAVAIDAGGHRTQDVYNYVRARMVRRPMAIFGAKPNNAPILSRGKLMDVNHRGKLDKRGVHIHHVGTVAIKHWLYARLSADADKERDQRSIHLSEDLAPEYFGGLVAETFNPVKNRFEKRRGAPRNEPLDTWAYAYAAAHHPELRLHRLRVADWDLRRKRLGGGIQQDRNDPRGTKSATAVEPRKRAGADPQDSTDLASSAWSARL